MTRQTRQRVEVRREDSGNASLAGRELDTLDALAVQGLHRRPRRPHPQLRPRRQAPRVIRARVMTELLQGRNPLDLLKPRPRPPTAPDDRSRPARPRPRTNPTKTQALRTLATPTTPAPTTPATSTTRRTSTTGPGYARPRRHPRLDPRRSAQRPLHRPRRPRRRRGPLRPGQTAPPPANLNLIIPIGTLLGWSTAPAHAGAFGLLDPDETRALVAAASRHPSTRWSATITDRARPRHRPRPRPRPAPLEPTTPSRHPERHHPEQHRPDPDMAARLRHLIRRPEDHLRPHRPRRLRPPARREPLHPSAKLKDLVRARTTTCDAPGCNAQAIHCDLDHTWRTPTAPPASATSGPNADATTAPSKHPAGASNNPSPASPAGPCPTAAPTPPPTSYENLHPRQAGDRQQ